jgi:hypothetical protein
VTHHGQKLAGRPIRRVRHLQRLSELRIDPVALGHVANDGNDLVRADWDQPSLEVA